MNRIIGYYLASLSLLVSCSLATVDRLTTGEETVTDTIKAEPEQEREVATSFIEAEIVSVDSIFMTIYHPHNCNDIVLLCGKDIPDGTQDKPYYCAAAAFTGKGYQDGFKHNLIAGDHVSQGVRYKGYRCRRNTGAFVQYKGKNKFLYKEYSHELDSAAVNNGNGFAQEMMIHQGKKVPTTRPRHNRNVFRAFCERGGEVCIIESNESVSFGTFIDCLVRLGATEALYLDMGGWSYSWYKDRHGETIRPYTNSKDVLTNVIVFTSH